VYVDSAGRPHFQINDDGKRPRAILEELCPICGKRLLRGRWFVGGPMSAFHPDGAYADPPMHTECMTYAMQVCPYIAAPRYTGRIDDRTLKDGHRTVLFADFTAVARRPPVFIAALATRQRITGASLSPNVIPRKPYLRIEFWQHGVKLDATAGTAIVDAERHTWDDLIANRLIEVRLI
jgi:hypothetical protein